MYEPNPEGAIADVGECSLIEPFQTDIPLDLDSVQFLEQVQRSDFVDVYIMNSKNFRARFIDLLAEEHQSLLPLNRGYQIDKQGNSYSRIRFTTENNPQIIFTNGAFPCSIVFFCDSNGNAVLSHMTQFLLFSENEQKRATQVETSSETFENLTQFINANIVGEMLAIITATNVNSRQRPEIARSLLSPIQSIHPKLVGCIFTQHGYRIRNSEPSSEDKHQEIKFSSDVIDSLFFLPKQITKSGRNILVLIGDTEDDKDDSLEDWMWRTRLN